MKRKSGILMHISSLWGNYSIGSFGKEATEFIDFLKGCGFSLWQVLPFCVPDICNSPYKSFSAFSGNPFFVDLPTLYEQGLLTREELEGAVQETPYICQFERLKKKRFLLLEKASDRFENKKLIEEFLEQNPHIRKFCEFMALKKSNDGKMWQEFEKAEPDAKEYRTWCFIQYMFFTQWQKIKDYANSRGIEIIGDIPIYVDLDSSDVWANKEQFCLEEDGTPSCVAGVPPDYFSEEGQLWGNPIYNWDYMEKDGFSWWKDRISFMAKNFDGIRIDHFRGIESYYTVPADAANAIDGTWKKGPGMKLIKEIKDAAGDTLLIAEDLGIITDEVRELVKSSGFPSMSVLQFAFPGDEDSPHIPHNYKNNSIAYTGTHDNNTLLGYIWELDEGTRRHVLEYCGFEGEAWDNCYDSILRTMLASHAGYVLFPIQDILHFGGDTRLNTPGKADGNWAFRVTKEQLDGVDKNMLKIWNRLYGRI